MGAHELALFKGPEIINNFDAAHRIILHCGDTQEFMETLPDETFKLIITSPPYNLGKEYEERISILNYLKDQESVITQLIKKLRKDGSLCWQVGNFVEDTLGKLI